MAGRLLGKKALITGGAQGLGAAIGQMMAQAGARVVLTDRNYEGVEATVKAINADCGKDTAIALAQDVADAGRWAEVVDEAASAMGGLNVLVNNAGIVVMGSIEELSPEDWHRSLTVNLDSVFYGTRAAIPVMRQTQPGSIINISSISGLVAGHNFAAYNASKAAVWLLTKSIALHCAREGLDIRCNSIHPTFIRTPILHDLAPQRAEAELHAKLAKQVPLGRLGEPEDVGYAAIYLASDESRFITAAELKIDGGISAR